MALNVNALGAYVDERRLPLIGRTIRGSKTAKLLSLQTGVKGVGAINLVTADIEFGDGLACGWDEAGETALTQRLITTGAIKINTSFCDKSLLNTWAGYDVKVAAGEKNLPFEEDFTNAQIEGISETLEVALWQGDITNLDPNLNRFDGLIKIIDNEATVIDADNTGINAITVANVMDAVDNVILAIPSVLLGKKDVVIAAGADTFQKYVMALKNANLFHYKYDTEEGLELVIPGTNVRLVAVDGLNGTDRMFAFRTSNVFLGTDLEGDAETFKIWYSEDNREFRMVVEFVMGVQVAYPDEVVQFTVA